MSDDDARVLALIRRSPSGARAVDIAKASLGHRARRHSKTSLNMTAAQRAMATAMTYPEPEKRGRGNKSEKDLAAKTFSSARLSQARAVLKHSPPIAQAVLSGSKSLDEAYNEVQIATGKINNDTIRLRKLRNYRPDLAERVELNETKLDEAEAQAKADAERRKQQRWAATKNLLEGVQLLERDAETAQELADEYDPSIAENMEQSVAPQRLRRVAAFASELKHHGETTMKPSTHRDEPRTGPPTNPHQRGEGGMRGMFAEPSSHGDGALVMGGCVSSRRTSISVSLPHASPRIAAQSGQSPGAPTHSEEPAHHGGRLSDAPAFTKGTVFRVRLGAPLGRPEI